MPEASHEDPAGVTCAGTCVGAGIRRHDGVFGANAIHNSNVIPTQVGIHASFHKLHACCCARARKHLLKVFSISRNRIEVPLPVKRRVKK
jgi:hypothetical protein